MTSITKGSSQSFQRSLHHSKVKCRNIAIGINIGAKNKNSAFLIEYRVYLKVNLIQTAAFYPSLYKNSTQDKIVVRLEFIHLRMF